MNDESTNPELTCWFCTKGRHKDCMNSIPINSYEDDCSFSVKFLECECHRSGCNKKGD